MANDKGNAIIKREAQLKQLRSNHEQTWEKLAPLMAPSRYGITSKVAEGQNTQIEVYDGTQRHAADVLANFISSQIINPKDKWCALSHQNPALKDLDEVREWCEEMGDIQMADIERSNFYAEAASSMVDLTGFGQNFLFYNQRPMSQHRKPEPGYRGSRFECSKIGRFLIARDENGEVDTGYRDFSYTVHQICGRWPEKDLPHEIQELKRDNPDRQFRIIHAIQPRPYGERKHGNKAMPYESCYVIAEFKHCVEESGFEDFPAVSAEWDRIPEEMYGRGRGELALHDSQTLQLAKKLGLEDHAIRIRPPIIANHDSLMGSIRWKPAGLIPIRGRGMPLNHSMMPWDSGSRPDITNIKEEQMRLAIRQAFFVDVLTQLMEMDLKDVNNYTYAKKLSLLFQILGPSYGRIQRQFLKRFIDGHLQLLWREGQLPPAPPAVLQSGDARIDVEFNNPLARAQKVSEVEAIGLWFNDMGPVIEAEVKLKGHSDALDWINVDEMAKGTARTRGIPAKYINNDKEVQDLRDARAEQQQAAQQAEDAMAITEGVKNITPALAAMQPQESA